MTITASFGQNNAPWRDILERRTYSVMSKVRQLRSTIEDYYRGRRDPSRAGSRETGQITDGSLVSWDRHSAGNVAPYVERLIEARESLSDHVGRARSQNDPLIPPARQALLQAEQVIGEWQRTPAYRFDTVNAWFWERWLHRNRQRAFIRDAPADAAESIGRAIGSGVRGVVGGATGSDPDDVDIGGAGKAARSWWNSQGGGGDGGGWGFTEYLALFGGLTLLGIGGYVFLKTRPSIMAASAAYGMRRDAQRRAALDRDTQAALDRADRAMGSGKTTITISNPCDEYPNPHCYENPEGCT